MGIQSKVDDWLTAGNNWRFIVLVASLGLVVTALVFGVIIKNRVNGMLVGGPVSKIASFPVADVADIPVAPVSEGDTTPPILPDEPRLRRWGPCDAYQLNCEDK